MEVHKENPDVKKPLEKEDKVDQFMVRWRHSEFYKFVMKVIDEEIDEQYLKEAMEAAYLEGSSLSNDEISDIARGETYSNLRLKKIKETLS